ncbi:MAG: alpha-E domain-containing protein [Chromatiaceae bacterium]|nr:alpha-E domain-containing protein [Gammaproteobacteria bacterium]MCP5318396.1 alpha-E domain-containing protein [Chromatiaceae bacterium]MCW5584905.1 alpha-E domain-containing protein [Chromatiales bacterium]MCP5435762.1 alpha-E domain-containing protein [Chromatiaceae bacterium]MCP5441265.1 alpha-E domain-containing protein [Chromatiaceae bacterium]
MLSRVAENIYWLARYVERAENTARLIRVNSHLVLDTPSGIAPGWEPLVDITGLRLQFETVEREPNERNIVRFLIGDAHNHGSILSSLAAARENCRTVREVLPRSSWEKLNELYLFAKENVQSGLTKSGRDDFLDGIISGSQQLVGLLGSVMYRDEAWHFSRIGRNLERADMTTRIIDVRSTDLFPDDMLESRSLDTLQWISVLRSMSGYQTYRRHVAIRVSRADVLDFLFHNPLFPRSFLHCISAVDDGIGKLENSGPALRGIRALKLKLRRVNVAELSQAQLHDFIDVLQLGIIDLHNSLAATYFPPELELEETG